MGEVCQFINGRAYNKQELLNKGKYTVLRVGNFFTNDHWYYSDLELEENKYCDTGDLLYAWSASFGPKIWDGGKVIYHYHIWKVIPNKDLVTKEFLYHLLDWDKDQIKIDQGAGTTMTHVSKGSMEERLVNIPPLPEQQRIVSVLDEAFASIAQAKSNAERNLVNARELFESVMQGIFSDRHDGWEEKSLQELGQITSSKRIYKNEYVKDGIPFYRIKEVKELANDKEISLELFIPNKRYKEIKDVFGVPVEGDLLVTAVGTIGEIYIVKKDDEFYFKDGNVLWFKDFKSIDPYFLKYALRVFVEKIKRLSAGAAYSALTIEKIEKHKVFVPPLTEQRAIVGRLEALSAKTKRLEEIYTSKLEALGELKKTMLGKAFAGEL